MSVQRNDRLLPNQPQIELRNVSRRYEMQRARRRSFQEAFIRLVRREPHRRDVFWPLRNISFTVHPGDCIGIVGPNGSGKSTLLKLITGILSPSEGDLIVNGRISSLLELGAGFHPDLTGRDNIYLNGSIYGLSRAEMDKHLDAIIDYAELGDFIDTPIKHYSSGMYVRLGFAVAIHTVPDLLLVDEVLAVGDAAFQRKCLNSIQKFRDNGGTLILVSHDLNAIQSICRRALWLEQGELVADGHPTDVVMAYIRHLAEKEEGGGDRGHGAREQGREGDEGQGTDSANEGGVDLQSKIQNPKPEIIRRWGTGQVRITQVELCNAGGQARTNFYNGEALTICLHYEADEPVAQPVFGLAIHHQNGTHIAGPNTKFADLRIPMVHGVGVISYHIPALPLLEGGYVVSAAVVNDANTETYDYHDRLYEFQVYRGQAKEQYGLVTLGGAWNIEAAGPVSFTNLPCSDQTHPFA